NHLTVRDGALARITGNFFTVNLEQVRTAFESVPWVRRASVRREWPDQLVVSLEEHEALGTWGEDGKLLSTKGDVVTVNLAGTDNAGDARGAARCGVSAADEPPAERHQHDRYAVSERTGADCAGPDVAGR